MPHKSSRSITGRLIGGVLIGAVAVTFLAELPANAQNPSSKPNSKTQAASDRVELIMGSLPPKGTAGYQALLAHAGPQARGQVLPLTQCEVWSIPRSRLSRLLEAAKTANVSVKQLDSGWNEVFAPAPAGAMSASAESMMAMAKQSRSTSNMEVMSQRTASMVEYALTKDMDTKSASARPMSIRIAINSQTTITALRREVVIEGERCTWRGIVEGTNDPVTIMWWGSGRMTGTIHFAGRLYQLRQLAPDVIGVVETMPAMLPDEHPRTSPLRMQQLQMRDDTVYSQGDTSAARPPRLRPVRDQVEDAKDDATSGKKPPANGSGRRSDAGKGTPVKAGPKPSAQSKSPAVAPKAVIEVMVAYTKNAAAHYGNITRDLIELAIEETNHSFRASRIDGVEVRLVHTHQTDYNEAGAEHFDHVWRMADRGDGHLEEIWPLRESKKADVVVLIVDDPSGCGLATRVAPDADEAFAVVHHECAATSYSIAHEIGHIVGARHDHSLDRSMTPYRYGHGFVSPDLKWRTMMSYKAPCNGCPRLPVWSTPEAVVNGKPAGDSERNNAQVLREGAARVAAFR